MTENPTYKKKDFVSDQEVRWCPGCGDYAILSSVQQALTNNIMTITVKGNVLPCFEDFHQNHEMGNVHETHLRDIWASEKYEQFRKDLARGLRHKYAACKGCNRTEVLF